MKILIALISLPTRLLVTSSWDNLDNVRTQEFGGYDHEKKLR